jgi:Bromodomain/TAZ zinc finger
MAKSLEEHLYRSAQTKEEYLDLSTLKKRLQIIAHGLELHRSTSAGSGASALPNDGLNQQQQLLRQMASNNMPGASGLQSQMRQTSGLQGSLMGNDDQIGSSQSQTMGGLSSSMFSGVDGLTGNGDLGSGMPIGDSSKYQDPIAQQKKKVIRQQQQRLLLLRHASKCTAGPTCQTKFCAQMVTLWKHMKKCRDKNCSTSHCLSSRCVLNHYRICKSQGRTASCEVCGPVMEQIKRQETGEEANAADPLTKDQEMPMLDGLVSSSNNGGGDNIASQEGSGDQQQLQQLHQAQMKLQNQLQVLKQLQRQQEQLLQQQRHLQEQQSHIKDPHTQQGQQLQQQQALLQQLQQRCQQQQVLLQQELALQSNAINTVKQNQSSQGQGGATPTEDQQSNAAAITGPPPTSLSLNSSKDLSGSSSSTRRAAPVRRQSKAKGTRGGGKGGRGEKNARQSDKGGAVDAKVGVKTDDDDNGQTQPKRRFSLTKGDNSMSGSMPEPARKMIKLEPHNKHGDEEKSSQHIEAHSGSDVGGGVKHEIGVIIEDNEAKKKLVIDDPFEITGDGSHHPQLTRESIEKHLKSIEMPPDMSADEVTKHCLPVVQDLVEDPFGWVFKDPVDPVALGLPDYFDVVKKPMHLDLVTTKLEEKSYESLESFQKDCSLVFENSILYNGESSEVGQLALTMLSTFAKMYEAMVKALVESTQATAAV